MCRTTAYKSTTCNHRWLTITTRCDPGAGFTTTAIHEFRSDNSFIWGKPSFMKAPAGSCPNCDRRGQYDGNTTRMVLGSGDREAQRNMWRMGQGGLVQNVGGWSQGYQTYDSTTMGTCRGHVPSGRYQQQQLLGNGCQQARIQQIPGAQRVYFYGQRPRAGISSCNLM